MKRNLLLVLTILGGMFSLGCEDQNYQQSPSYYNYPLSVTVVGNNWSSHIAGLAIGAAEPTLFGPSETTTLYFNLLNGEEVQIWGFLFDEGLNILHAEPFTISNRSPIFHVDFTENDIDLENN